MQEFGDPLANPNATFVPRAESLMARVEPGAVGSVLVLAVLGSAWLRFLNDQETHLEFVEHAPARALLTAGVEVRYPWLITTGNSTHIIEPIAQIYARNDEEFAGQLPNEDSQSLVFDASNLFSRNKFSGFDRVEGGTRANVGMLDASTLGKIIVKGPDAGKFLDMLYTGVMSNLPVGKCRYGLMCNEQGFLSDDGVVIRLSEDSWLCHTTTGGADRIHAWMEDWLQCEWWDWQVYTANVTEEYAQIAVAGPKARKVLEKLGGMDVSKETLPFMQWADGTLGGFPVRVYRISFSGELSYEIAIPASHDFMPAVEVTGRGALHLAA